MRRPLDEPGRLVEQVRLLVARDAAQQQWLVEELGETVDDGVAWVCGHARREFRLAAEKVGHAFEERAAAGQDEPAVVEVGGDFGLQLAERAVDDARDALNHALGREADLPARHVHGARRARLHVAPLDALRAPWVLVLHGRTPRSFFYLSR